MHSPEPHANFKFFFSKRDFINIALNLKVVVVFVGSQKPPEYWKKLKTFFVGTVIRIP